MIKKIKELVDKRKEKKLLFWIASHDIRYEKYKYFYGDMVSIDLTNIYLSNIDDYIYGFIEDGGQLVYAYNENVYQKTKELKKQNIPYCFTENEYETKLNYLIKKKEYIPPPSFFVDNGNIVYVNNYRYVPYFYTKSYFKKIKKEAINIVFGKDIKYLWVGSKTLEKDIKECKSKNYRFTIQENLVKEIDYGP